MTGSGLAARALVPELLDALPPDDPRALASRRDLRLVNRLMGQARLAAGLVCRHAPGARSILEIGAGDGRAALGLAGRLAGSHPDATLTLLDQQAIVSDETRRSIERLGWQARTVTADVFAFLDATDARFDLVLANLFLHHFDDAALRRLFDGLSRVAPVLVATEPRRALFPLLASRSLVFLGANTVTRHDAPASVRAGFRDRELSALWPASGWTLEEGEAMLFTHVFAALREARP